MRVLFVRHASALAREGWLRDDMERPLSDKGIINAKKLFKEYAKIYDAPSVIYTSEALRARETAQLLKKSFKTKKTIITPLLNPGASYSDFCELLKDESSELIALVGHEPDFSSIISALISNDSSVEIDIKKASLVEVEVDKNFRGVLKAFLVPKVFL